METSVSTTLTIRPSSIGTYMMCSMKFYYQNVAMIEVPRTPHLALGTSIHAPLEHNYRQKVSSYVDLPVEEILDVFSTVWEREAQEIDRSEFLVETKGDIKDTGVKLLRKYREEVAPKIQPKLVETRLSIRFPANDTVLSGQLDVVDVFNNIIDHKTTRITPSGVNWEYILQQTAYKIIAATHGIEVAGSRIDYFVKGKNPRIMHFNFTPDEEHFMLIFGKVVKGIRAGHFIPNRGHMFCSKRTCKFWQQCLKDNKGEVKD